ncbi:hypothetical protein Tco_1447858, partial [Tanacetum coccineum]
VNSVNTAKGKMVTSVVGEQGIDAVKSKACWVWRPKLKVLDHVSKNSGSYIWEDIDDSMNILSVLVVYHTTNGHQFTMSNRQERISYSKRKLVGDEAIHKELGDRIERAATTASSLEAEHDSDAQTRFEAASKSPMIHLSQEVTHLEVMRAGRNLMMDRIKLVKRVKHLEDQLKSTTKRRKEKVVISHEEEDLVLEDPSKQERMSTTKYGNVETEHAE